MAKVSIYLNFLRTTEEAFNFYKKVFRTEFTAPFFYMRDMNQPGMPPLAENEQNAVMHVELPILNGTTIMGTDVLESMGHVLKEGNNVTISLEPDSIEETDRLFNELSENGSDIAPMTHQFWGYWGCCKDKYGVRWMLNFPKKQ